MLSQLAWMTPIFGAQEVAPQPPPTTLVEVLTEDGLVPLGYYKDSPSFLAPLTSLSPLVKRAARQRDAFEFRVGGAKPELEISVMAIVHSKDEFVVLDGSRPQVVGQVEAASAAQTVPREGKSVAQPWDLAHLVRRDGHFVGSRGGFNLEMTLTPPAKMEDGGKSLLLFGRSFMDENGFGAYQVSIDGVDAALTTDPLRPLFVEASQASIRVSSRNENCWFIDAAMYASHSSPTAQLSLEAEFIEAGSPVDVSRRVRCAVTPELASALEDPGANLTLWLRVGDPTRETTSQPVTKMPAVETPASGPLRDVTAASGINAVHFEGEAEQLDIRPTMGPGAAWGDIDGDGRQDAVILQGGGRPGTEALADRVYRGIEGGRFEDITANAGLGRGDAGMGALLVDINGDGPLDLYCANYGQDRLFLGQGDGTFVEAVGLLPKLDLWSASVAAADPDGDGDLDLYISSYLDYDTDKMPPEEELGRYQREDPTEMLPFAFPGQRNVFLRNMLSETGTLGFEDVTETLGLLDIQGRGMQIVFWDFDRDGDEDLYVANDVSMNVLYRNEGDGTFKDVSFSTGLDDPRGGMGLALGDVDLDGDEDVFLTNWELEANALYLNSVLSHSGSKRRRASFHDYTVRSGLGPSGIGATSWGAELFDLDLDGDLDLYVANGYTSPDYESTGICVGQLDHLFLGDGTGKFAQVAAAATGVGHISQASRGAIGADYDGDGDVDLLVTANNGRAVLLQNNAERKGHWMGLRLRQPGPNTRAIGAEVTLTTREGTVLRRAVRAGQGYLTGNAPELHFGLGEQTQLESVEVRWPDGERTQIEPTIDRWQTIERTQ
jgi:hypothetical protein